MSKYIDLGKVKELVFNADMSMAETEALYKSLDNLPTIEVSEDCISREQVRAKLDYISYAEKDPISIAKRIVENAPSVVPSRAEGEWLLDGRCSNCLQAPLTTHKTYCPNCGADMRGSEE